MKYQSIIFLTLLFSHNVFATNLCDESCELSITFPEGGLIEAKEAMTVTFGIDGVLTLGSTGTINTNPQPASTDFLAGGVLQLAKGDSISFDREGSINLGVGGNIEYINMLIDSSGEVSLKAVEGSEIILIENLILSGAGTLRLNSQTILNGELTVNGDLVINVSNLYVDVVNPGINTTSSVQVSDVTLSIGDIDVEVASATILTSGLVIDAQEVISTGVITQVDIIPNEVVPEIVVAESMVLENEIPLVTIIQQDEIMLMPPFLTQQILSSQEDGVEMDTEDGDTCIMSAAECVSSTGKKYVVLDGLLVEEKTGAGVVSPVALLLVFWLQLLLAYRCYFSERKPQ